MKMTRMPKKTLIAKGKLKEGYYDAGRRFCATQPFRSGQRAAALICTGTGVGVGKSRIFTGPTLFYHSFDRMLKL